jgi:hypothetical protein
LPILDRNKALVGIVSGDIALEDMDNGATAEALHGIAQPTGGHEQ